MAIFMDNGNKQEIENVTHKPCPFCGNTRLFISAENDFNELCEEHGRAMIKMGCNVCKTEMHQFDVPNNNYWLGVGMIISRWNTRNGGNNDGN